MFAGLAVLAAWVLFACVCDAGEISPARTDGYGDPLPQGVLARLGSTRFRCDFEPDFMEISPDSRRLAVASNRGHVVVFDWPSGLVLGNFDGTKLGDDNPFSELRELHFAADPRRLILVCRNDIHALDTATGRYLTPLTRVKGRIECVSPDRSRALSMHSVADRDGVLRKTLTLHDLQRGRSRQVFLAPPQAGTLSVAIAPDNRRIAVTCGDTTGPPVNFVAICDLETGLGTSYPTPKDDPYGVEFSPDGRTVLRACKGYGELFPVVPARNRDSAPTLGPCVRIPVWPDDPTLSFVDGGREILTVGRDHNIHLIDAESRTAKRVIHVQGRHYLKSIRLSPDGRWLAALDSGSHTPAFWDGRTGSRILAHRGHEAQITGLAFAADGRTLYSASFDGTVKTWTVAPHVGYRPVGGGRTAVAEERWPSREVLTRKGGEGQRNLQLDGPRLTSQTIQAELLEWDLRKRAPYRIAHAHDRDRHDRFPPDRPGWVLSQSEKRLQLRAIDTRTGETFAPIHFAAPIKSADFHPDGRTVLVGDREGRVTAHDSVTGQKLETVPAFAGGLARRYWIDSCPERDFDTAVRDRATGSVVFTVSGSMTSSVLERGGQVVYGIVDKAVVRVDAASGVGSRVDAPTSAANSPISLALSPDGGLLAVGYESGEILLIDRRPHPRDASAPPTLDEWQSLFGWIADPFYEPRRHAALVRQYPALVLDEIRKRQRLPLALSPDRLTDLLMRLDDADFRKREAASRELSRSVTSHLPDLEAFLSGETSLEAKGRVRRLLDRETGTPASGERLRNIRIVGLLETIGTPEVLPMLREYAACADARISTAAKDALVRLKK